MGIALPIECVTTPAESLLSTCVFKCLPKPLKTQGLCIPLLPHWVARRPGFQVRKCQSSARLHLLTLRPDHPVCPGVQPYRKLWGISVIFTAQCLQKLVPQSPAGRNLGPAFDMSHVRITFTQPLIIARFPPSGVFAVTALPACKRCEVVEMERHTDLPLLCVFKYINPGWFHDRAIGHCIPLLSPGGLYGGQEKVTYRINWNVMVSQASWP